MAFIDKATLSMDEGDMAADLHSNPWQVCHVCYQAFRKGQPCKCELTETAVSRSEELATAHWRYIEDVLRQHGESEHVIAKVGFHYRTAMIHGYKHGVAEGKT